MEMNTQSYNRIKFATPPAQREMTGVELKIDAPRMCPVCGSKDVSKLIKIGASNLGFFSSRAANSIRIKVWVCKAHENLKTPSVRRLRGTSIIFEYFLDQCAIHAAREDWVAEFRAKNTVDSVDPDCRPFDVNNVTLTKWAPKLLIGWILSLFMMFVFNLIIPYFIGHTSWDVILFTASMVIMIAFIFAYLVVMIYLNSFKIPALQEMDYFGKKLRSSWQDYLRAPVTDFYR